MRWVYWYLLITSKASVLTNFPDSLCAWGATANSGSWVMSWSSDIPTTCLAPGAKWVLFRGDLRSYWGLVGLVNFTWAFSDGSRWSNGPNNDFLGTTFPERPKSSCESWCVRFWTIKDNTLGMMKLDGIDGIAQASVSGKALFWEQWPCFHCIPTGARAVREVRGLQYTIMIYF